MRTNLYQFYQRFVGLGAALLASTAPFACHDHDHDHDHNHGAEDLFARLACDTFMATAQPVMAGTDVASAAVINASAAPYRVTLPATGTGYLRLAIPHQHYDWGLFASTGITKVQQGATQLASSPPPPNPLCPMEIGNALGMHLHVTTDLLVTLTGSAQAPIWLFFTGAPSGHYMQSDAGIMGADARPHKNDAHDYDDAHAHDADRNHDAHAHD